MSLVSSERFNAWYFKEYRGIFQQNAVFYPGNKWYKQSAVSSAVLISSHSLNPAPLISCESSPYYRFPSCPSLISWSTCSSYSDPLWHLDGKRSTIVIVLETVLRNGMEELRASKCKFWHFLYWLRHTRDSSFCRLCIIGVIEWLSTCRSDFLSLGLGFREGVELSIQLSSWRFII